MGNEIFKRKALEKCREVMYIWARVAEIVCLTVYALVGCTMRSVFFANKFRNKFLKIFSLGSLNTAIAL